MRISGGEKQRVAIARALINDLMIVMGDEPTGNLDKKNGDLVLAVFKELSAAFKQTQLIVTHDPSFAKKRIESFEWKTVELFHPSPDITAQFFLFN